MRSDRQHLRVRRNFTREDVQLISTPGLGEIERFRYRIYIEEQGKFYPGADHRTRRLTDELDQGACHFVIRAHSEIVGYFRVHLDVPLCVTEELGLLEISKTWSGRIAYMSRLMVDGSFRSTNAAVALLQKAYELGISNNIEVAVSHCRPHLLPLYRRMGCRPFGRTNGSLHGEPQIPIVLLLTDYGFLHSIRSPLQKCFRDKSDTGTLQGLHDFFFSKLAFADTALDQIG